MRRLILAALVSGAAFAFPAVAMADPPICHDGILSDDAGQGCTNDGPYGGLPAAVTASGPSICYDGILSDDIGQGCPNDAAYGPPYSSGSGTRYYPTQARTYHPSYSAPAASGGGLSDVPGVPPSFASCVAMRESTNGAGSSNIYGIQGPGGQGSLAEQKQAFAQMYAQRGTEPWAPYDGC